MTEDEIKAVMTSLNKEEKDALLLKAINAIADRAVAAQAKHQRRAEAIKSLLKGAE